MNTPLTIEYTKDTVTFKNPLLVVLALFCFMVPPVALCYGIAFPKSNLIFVAGIGLLGYLAGIGVAFSNWQMNVVTHKIQKTQVVN